MRPGESMTKLGWMSRSRVSSDPHILSTDWQKSFRGEGFQRTIGSQTQQMSQPEGGVDWVNWYHKGVEERLKDSE